MDIFTNPTWSISNVRETSPFQEVYGETSQFQKVLEETLQFEEVM